VLFYCQNLGGGMPDSETYGMRLEKKLDQLRQEMSEMNNNVIRLSERNEYYQSQAVANRRDIDLLQADMNQAKGGLTFAKALGGSAIGLFIAFGSWVFQSNAALGKENAGLNQKLAIIESKQIRMDTDLAALRNQIDQQKK
jgi:peptidoglycan hydrolase CwlO-like protein